MYNIKILQECDEYEYMSIIAVMNIVLSEDNYANNLIVRRFKHSKETVPEWAAIGRQERLKNKF